MLVSDNIQIREQLEGKKTHKLDSARCVFKSLEYDKLFVVAIGEARS